MSELEFQVLDLGQARRAEFLLHLKKLGAQQVKALRPAVEDLQVVGDLHRHLAQLAGDLVALQAGQALQAQIEDRLGLRLRQLVGPRHLFQVRRIVDQLDELDHRFRRPGPRDQLLLGGLRVGRAPDQLDDRIEIRDRHRQAHQVVGLLAGLAQQVGGAPGDDLFAELDERSDDLLQVQQFRSAAVERERVDAEAGLQPRELEQLIEHDVRHRLALQLDDDAHALAVAFIANGRDAVDQLFLHHFGHARDHARLVGLIGNLGDDDGFAVAHILDMGAAAHDDRAAAGVIGLADPVAPHDDAAGREIRSRHMLDQLIDGDLRILEIGDAGIDHFRQIVGRDVGRHADRDAGRAVDQQVRPARRQDRRLLRLVVVVGLEIDRLVLEVVEQRFRRLGQLDLGVAHRRRRIAVHRAEIALPVGQRDAHGKILRHAHQRVVDRLVAVRVIVTHDFADRAGGFLGAAHWSRSRPRTCRRGCGDGPASGRRARPAARG